MRSVPEQAGLGRPGPSAVRLFLAFAQIGLSSFGGGLSGWMLREFVQRRNWLGEDEFLNGLAVSQALPGINVSNMAVWMGFRLAGTAGALAAVAGVVVPPAITIVLLAVAFAALTRFELAHLALDGAAAAAIGLSLSMGITTVRRVQRRLVPLLFVVATFVAVGVLHVSLVWVVLVGGAASVAHEYVRVG